VSQVNPSEPPEPEGRRDVADPPPAFIPHESGPAGLEASEQTRRAAPHAATNDLFEIWLLFKLRWMFASTLTEPIPPKLLRILETDSGTAGTEETEKAARD